VADPTDKPAPTPPDRGSKPWAGPWQPPPGRGSWSPDGPSNGWRAPAGPQQPGPLPPPPVPTTAPGGPGRNPVPRPPRPPSVLRVELAVVLLLALSPGLLGLLVIALGAADTGPRDVQLVPAILTAVIDLVLQWSPILLVAYLLRRSREGWAGIGLGRLRAREVGQGAVLWVASWLLVYVLALAFQFLGQREVDFLPPSLPLWFRIVDAVVIATTAGVTEEITVRGYAQTRLEQLRAPTAAIVVLPTLLWGFLHLYQGLGAALTIFGLGLMYAVYYHRTRRLWPLILAHGLFDLTQLVLILAGL
jgi:membrane protease YdiL (CAAX protease family)